MIFRDSVSWTRKDLRPLWEKLGLAIGKPGS